MRTSTFRLRCAFTGNEIKKPVIYRNKIVDRASLMTRGVHASELVPDFFTQELMSCAQENDEMRRGDLEAILVCPITLKFPQNAVLCAVDGCLYDREAFIQYYGPQPSRSVWNGAVIRPENLFVHPLYEHLMQVVRQAQRVGTPNISLSAVFRSFNNADRRMDQAMDVFPPRVEGVRGSSLGQRTLLVVRQLWTNPLSSFLVLFPYVWFGVLGWFLGGQWGLWGHIAGFLGLLSSLIVGLWVWNTAKLMFPHRFTKRFRRINWRKIFKQGETAEGHPYELPGRTQALLGVVAFLLALLFLTFSVLSLYMGLGAVLALNEALALTGGIYSFFAGMTACAFLIIGGVEGASFSMAYLSVLNYVKPNILHCTGTRPIRTTVGVVNPIAQASPSGSLPPPSVDREGAQLLEEAKSIELSAASVRLSPMS